MSKNKSKMKTNFFKIAAIFAGLALTVASCNGTDPEQPKPVFPSEKIQKTVLAGESVNVEFDANLDWELSLSGEGVLTYFWIDDAGSRESKISGKAGKQNVKVVFSEDEELDNNRKCIVKLTMGGETQEIAQIDRLLDDIPGGAGNIGDDAAGAAGKEVHQGRFADVGLADNDGVDALADESAAVEVSQQLLQFPKAFLTDAQNIVLGQLVDVLFRIVDISRKVSADGEKLVSDTLDFAVEGAVHGAFSRAHAPLGTGADEIGDRFRLGQGHFPV